MQKLPNYSTLTPEARAEYLYRVNAWLSGDRSNLAEGVLLCSAIPQASVFVDYSTAYSADKRRSEIVRYLTPLCPEILLKDETDVPGKSPKMDVLPKNTSGVATERTIDAGRTFVTAAGTSYHIDDDGNITAVEGNRPAHFDEWLDRMPAELQEKIATLKENFTQLVEYRRKAESLAADPNHSKSELSRYARLAVAYEARNLNIFAQADVCWDELCGRAVSDEIKKELAQEERKIMKDIASGDFEEDAEQDEELDAEQETECPVEGFSDKEMSEMPIVKLLALSSEVLPEGPRRYWLKRRCDQAQKYLRDKLPAEPSEAQKEKARQYALDIIAINGKLSKKVAEKLDTLSINIEQDAQ